MKLYTSFNPTLYETHTLVYARIEPGSEVLDVGCATGYFAKKLLEKDCKIWGIDSDKEATKVAKKYCEEVIVADLEALTNPFTPGESSSGRKTSLRNTPSVFLPFRKKFDYILLLDVIEHLRNPKSVLQMLKPYLKSYGKLIISTPNIAFISVRLSFVLGKFIYKDFGILDKSHLHFYTKKTFIELINSCGLKIIDMDVASGFSQITKIGKYLNYIPKYWQYKITKRLNTLLGYQFIAICNK